MYALANMYWKKQACLEYRMMVINSHRDVSIFKYRCPHISLFSLQMLAIKQRAIKHLWWIKYNDRRIKCQNVWHMQTVVTVCISLKTYLSFGSVNLKAYRFLSVRTIQHSAIVNNSGYRFYTHFINLSIKQRIDLSIYYGTIINSKGTIIGNKDFIYNPMGQSVAYNCQLNASQHMLENDLVSQSL